jgi:SulP family sulfate permease
MVGAIQIAMAALRLGFLVNFLSRPVVIGFTTGAPILIALSQLDTLLGVSIPRTTVAHRTLIEIGKRVSETHLLTLAFGVGGIVALLGLKKIHKRIPGPLVVVGLATALAWGLGLSDQGVANIGKFEASLPTPVFPLVSLEVLRDLLPTAITLALVQFMALISIAKSFGARDGYEIDPNRELRALGLSNAIGSFFRSPPVSGSFSRSSIAYDSGAATSMSNVFAALTVLVAILFLSPVFEFIPMPVLGAIILVSALGMVVPRDIKLLFDVKRADGFVALVTMGTTLVLGIQEGVLLGVGAAMALMLYRNARPPVVELARDADSVRWWPKDEVEFTERHERILVLRIDGSLTFVNAEYVKETILRRAVSDREIEAIVIDFRSVNDVDVTAIATFEMMVDVLASKGVVIYFSNLKEGPRATFEAASFLGLLPSPGVFATTEEGVQHAREKAHGQTEVLDE